jgi:hypothetical protein
MQLTEAKIGFYHINVTFQYGMLWFPAIQFFVCFSCFPVYGSLKPKFQNDCITILASNWFKLSLHILHNCQIDSLKWIVCQSTIGWNIIVHTSPLHTCTYVTLEQHKLSPNRLIAVGRISGDNNERSQLIIEVWVSIPHQMLVPW